MFLFRCTVLCNDGVDTTVPSCSTRGGPKDTQEPPRPLSDIMYVCFFVVILSPFAIGVVYFSTYLLSVLSALYFSVINNLFTIAFFRIVK